jgi:hypothetical protein
MRNEVHVEVNTKMENFLYTFRLLTFSINSQTFIVYHLYII